MEKLKLALLLFFFALVAAFLYYINIPGKYDEFAKCLTAKGAVMYGTNWCPHCAEQKAMFGKSFKYINFVDCNAKKQICLEKGIQVVPTWIINGKYYIGVQSLEKLASITGCKLK